MRYDFFKRKENSNIVLAKGPDNIDQLRAIYDGKYYSVLTGKILSKNKALFKNDKDLLHAVNAIKAAIQTFGPDSNNIPGLRTNTHPKTKGHTFHAHANSKNGTYVLEWEIIDEIKRIVALVGFGQHENYKFKDAPYTDKEKNNILSDPKTLAQLDYISKKISEVIEKVERQNKIQGTGLRPR